jgi:hypothetical protein
MKKKMCVVIFVWLGFFSFGQSKQVKMYLEAIEANAVYVQYLKKAISIARVGLTTISDIKNGEFNLHNIFIKGLSSVNPKIRSWSKVADIISYQINIVKTYKVGFKQVKESGQFTDTEINYIFSVFSKLLDDCVDVIEMLVDVLTDGEYKMSDDERMRRIDILYANMQSNYKFCQKFSNNNAMLSMQRMKEKSEAAESKKLFDIH